MAIWKILVPDKMRKGSLRGSFFISGEDRMGGSQSKNDPNTDKGVHTTTAPRITPAPCPSDKELHLALAFLAGSLLTLLLMALVFFIIKSYRKCEWPREMGQQFFLCC
uniref:Uncharacterized protein n=1 Tax=Myotis myotis TaxID=51298 RepID=A0A7J7SPC7_MYOMY|nr:hypothetical protein mMyoMyo1_001764 [Myotis myotis]